MMHNSPSFPPAFSRKDWRESSAARLRRRKLFAAWRTWIPASLSLQKLAGMTLLGCLVYPLPAHAIMGPKCGIQKERINGKLEQAKACMTDADCVIISPGCGYGCQLPLNKAVSGDIMSDAGVYGQNCGGDCGPKDCPPPPSLGKDAHGKDIEVVAGCVSNVCKIVQQLSPVTVTPLPERTPVPARRPIPRPMQHP